MPKTILFKQDGSQAGEIELNETIFGVEPNEALIFEAIVMSRASLRQGTHAVKNRSEVRGGGRKPWRQKGTGRARQGSIRAAQWYHGGIVFGPHNRDYSFKMNRKERRLALKSALAYKVIDNELIVVDALDGASNKTKDAKAMLKALNVEGKVLLVTDELTDNLILSTRNLRNVMLLSADEINTYDVVASDKMVITEKALKQVEEALK